MNLSNYTIKAAEVVQQSQQIAFNAQHASIETEHLLKALTEQKEVPIDYLLKKNNVTLQLLQNRLDEALSKLPKSSNEPAQMLGREANNALLRAGAATKTFGDEFVTPEHLLLALVQGADNTAKILKEAGLTEKGLILSIKELERERRLKVKPRKRLIRLCRNMPKTSLNSLVRVNWIQ